MTSCQMFPDHTTPDSSREAGGLIRSGDGNDLVFSTSEPRAPIIAYKSYHHRPQVKTINHSTQLIIQINRQGIICTSSTVIENNAASASIQFESGSVQIKLYISNLFLVLTLYINTITRLNFPLEANYNTGQFSPFRVGSNLDSRSESEGSSRG